MKTSDTKPTRMVNEPGDSEMQVSLAMHFNGMMDALAWFFENGVAVAIKKRRSGYSITFSNPSANPKPKTRNKKRF